MVKAEKTNNAQQGSASSVGLVCFWLFTLLLFAIYFAYINREGNFWLMFQKNLFEIYQWVGHHAGLLVLSLLFLPTFGVPISPFWVLAGALWDVKLSLVICFLCIGFNLVLSYFFYRKCLNRLLFKLIFRNKPIPKFPQISHLRSLRLVLLIQLIPHIPYSAQCYLLSILQEVNFWHYLSLSWAFQFLWACVFILSGESIKVGQWGLTIFCFILLCAYLTYRGYLYYKRLE